MAFDSAPIGVFDSGIGGLSVLMALRAALPHEDFVYLADSACAPYGERGDDFVAQRTQAIASHLRRAHGAKLLVIACNTASAAGAQLVRRSNPGWPVVAIEPALKPAAYATRSGAVGVWATRGTVASARFAALRDTVLAGAPQLRLATVACNGLAHAIEQRAAGNMHDDEIDALLLRCLADLGPLGTAPGQIDTLVLGCTHYPLVRERIARLAPPAVSLIEPGAPVARQAQRLLHATGLLKQAPAGVTAPTGSLKLLATGQPDALQAAAQRWLHSAARVERAGLDG